MLRIEYCGVPAGFDVDDPFLILVGPSAAKAVKPTRKVMTRTILNQFWKIERLIE
jgi:hypothetical protein